MKKIIIILFVLFILISSKNIFAQDNEEARQLSQQGMQAYQKGEYQEAAKYFEKELEIRRKVSSPIDIASNLSSVGLMYYSLNKYDTALPYFEESLKLYKELKSYEFTIPLYSYIGSIYMYFGQFEKVYDYLKQALDICRNYELGTQEGVILENLAVLYSTHGQYGDALDCYEKALKIFKQLDYLRDEELKAIALSKDPVSSTLSSMSRCYLALGEYEKALSTCEEAFKQAKTPRGRFIALAKKAEIYCYFGQYDNALINYKEALKISKEIKGMDPYYTAVFNGMGSIYFGTGQYEKAIDSLEEALKIAKEIKIVPNIAVSLTNIGYTYLEQKKFKEAEKAFFEAEGYFKKMDAWSELGLLDLYLATGEPDKTLALLEKIPAHNFEYPGLNQIWFRAKKGSALKAKGALKDASIQLLKAVLLAEEFRGKIIRQEQKITFFQSGFGGYVNAYRDLVSVLAQRYLKGEKQDSEFKAYGRNLASAAFYFAESTKARTLLEAIASSGNRYKKEELPEQLRAKEQDLLNQLFAIENIWEETYKKSDEGFEELARRKEHVREELDSLTSQLRKDYPLYAALNYPKPLFPEELPLKEKEVLLEFALSDDASYLFKVEKNKPVEIIKINKGKEEIENLVADFCEPFNRNPLTADIRYQDFSLEKAKALYELLLSGALNDVSQDKNLIIVPDGILGVLPFEALVINNAKNLGETKFVADKYKITYYQSASVLALNRLLKSQVALKPFFALGNPIYNKDDPRYLAYKQGKSKTVLLSKDITRSSYRGLSTHKKWGDITFAPLPETEEEIKTIAGYFNTKPEPPDILLGIYANETHMRSVSLSQYRFLHFATHADLPGKVQGINEPFLLLGQVENSPDDDGFLSLSEVLNLRLNADMVVLSACVTGEGKVMEGEGLVNFARAFHYAGSRTVLVSLWEVASEPTAEYMELFYQYLKEGKSKIDALSLARGKIKQKYPNPFFWAVFIMHGEGEK